MVSTHVVNNADFVQCDLHMPNKDGYQTCKEIRKWEKENKYPYLPIIRISHHGTRAALPAQIIQKSA